MTQRSPIPELRDVRGYERLYGVTRDGQVFSYRTGKWLKFDETQGYLRAPLNRRGRTKFVKVHRLVAQAWVPNPEGKPEINHRDGNKKNNRDTNLEWVTRQTPRPAVGHRARHALPVLRVRPPDRGERDREAARRGQGQGLRHGCQQQAGLRDRPLAGRIRRRATPRLGKRGHIGTVYQALNAAYLGRSRGGTMILARDGRIVSRRALSKLRNDEVGAGYAYEQLLALGAPERRPFEGGKDYAERALREGGFRLVRHPGNHTYAWWLGDRRARPAWQALPYPKAVA